jgi:hypothetical protein
MKAAPVAFNKPVLVEPLPKITESEPEEYGDYGDFWGQNEFVLPKQSMTSSVSTASLKSVESTTSNSSYGSYWGTDMEEE